MAVPKLIPPSVFDPDEGWPVGVKQNRKNPKQWEFVIAPHLRKAHQVELFIAGKRLISAVA